MPAIDNSRDVIDSREIIERIDELKALQKKQALDAWDESELETLQNLDSEDIAEWHDGATLIRDSYFTEYARELAQDIGVILRDGGWPVNCIDWDKAADELKTDYQLVDFDGIDYWVRP